MTARPLSARQQRFIDEYLVDGNATQAAIRAGYSAHTAAVIGAENLRKPKIASAVAAARQARSARTQTTADGIVAELWENHRLARETKNLHASNVALRMLGDHLGMFADRAWSPDDVAGMLARVAEIIRAEVRDAPTLERIERAWKASHPTLS